MWPKVIRVAGLLGLTAGVVACEDKSLAMDAANLGNLLQVRASLACRAAAGYPTHLAELFIRRVELHAPELGQRQPEHLSAKAYELIADLEGQNN